MFETSKIVFNELFIGMILLVVVPTALLGVVASGNINLLTVLGAAVLIAALQIAPNVLNNYVDWDIDKINKKRVKMQKLFAKRQLLLITALFIAVTIPFFILGNAYLKITMIVAYFMIIGYNLLIRAKDILLLNYAFIAIYYGPVAYSIGFFLSSANIPLFNSLIWIPIFIVCMNMGFSIIKDYGDVKGDKALNKKTLPVVIGKKWTLICQFVAITAVFAVTIYLGLTTFNWMLSILLLIPYVIALYAMSLVISPKDPKAYSKASNIIRANALLVMLILFLYFV